MKDWTFDIFVEVLKSFKNKSYQVSTFKEYVENTSSSPKQLILRHDVDRFPNQTLQMAIREAEGGFNATYYFRIIPSVFRPEIIRKVVGLGHEIGYHYEDLSICKGDIEKSIEHFKRGLEKLRKYYPVKTICMHGSPLSKWDNKTLWNHYDYREFGIIADTSFDIDYNRVFYITDNGMGWNRTSVSVRDKVETKFNIPIENSQHLIELVKSGKLPDQVMINAHPDTFFDPGFKWFLNSLFIKSKNVIKRQIVKYRIFK